MAKRGPIRTPASLRLGRMRRAPLGVHEDSSPFLVVGIGASTFGDDACGELLRALPVGVGMAVILVRAGGSSDESPIADLVADDIPLTVREATDGTPIEREHLYVVPPGSYLTVSRGVLRSSAPVGHHERPFDVLLHSLAKEFGPRAVCVILSGADAPGALGPLTVVEGGGVVIAQDPREAGHAEMVGSAIASGVVDLLLPLARIPEALEERARRTIVVGAEAAAERASPVPAADAYSKVMGLLRTASGRDFAPYKEGTLRRRIARRMAMAGFEHGDLDRYHEILRRDAVELDLLTKDLIVNVTSFFRDQHVFDALERKILPDLASRRGQGHPLRIWVAGCGLGEDAYSLAMLLREAAATDERDVKVQIFASDADPDAVAAARKGFYPRTIEADLSPARLARFFLNKGDGYEVLPELRAMVLFAVQDVLADPPFSRLDLVLCRNFLVDLTPEAQAKVISVFDFALRDGGVLVLGSAETPGDSVDRFSVISDAERLYRHVARVSPVKSNVPVGAGKPPEFRSRLSRVRELTSRSALAELCRTLVFETYAPAAVLINTSFKCLYSLGPTHRYLRVAPGIQALDLLALAPAEVRDLLRSAVHRAAHERVRVVVDGGQTNYDGRDISFDIAVQPVSVEGETLLLVCFIDEQTLDKDPSPRSPELAVAEIVHLRQELNEARTEIQDLIHDFEITNEEQKTLQEEAWSVNEEFQSVNEELLISKEELHALNTELSSINEKLHESLEQQIKTLNNFRDIFFSTEVATIFLDANLNIRLFTPATKSFFNLIPGDVGRPLADLRLPAADSTLLTDARTTLQTLAPIEMEIKTESGAWYTRRILPLRAADNTAEGVVVTFSDVTERKRATVAVEAALQQAERANIANSRLLAETSINLRLSLQAFAQVQRLLAKTVKLEPERQLVAKLDEMVRKMSGILKPILGVDKLETDLGRPEITSVSVNDMLLRLRAELNRGDLEPSVAVRVAPCRLFARSDARLLEEMIGHLLSNALRYTKRGKVLLGCRRRGGALNIEIWDTGIGMSDTQLVAIREELRRSDDAPPRRDRDIGLGLSNVRRLGALLNHRVSVRSELGKGSVFTVEVTRATDADGSTRGAPPARLEPGVVERDPGGDSILLIEGDPKVRERLGHLLERERYVVTTAQDGFAAIELVAREQIHPDLIVADYDLPNGMNGIEVATRLKERLRPDIPVIVLAGDAVTDTPRDAGGPDYRRLHKPVQPDEMRDAVRRLLAASSPAPRAARPVRGRGPIVFAIIDDSESRDELRGILQGDGWTVDTHATAEAFLNAYRPGREACILVDAHLPGMSGLELMRRLHEAGHVHPVIMISGHGDVSIAVQAMKAGALDFIEKPVVGEDLLASVRRAFDRSSNVSMPRDWRKTAVKHFATLTLREREIMKLVLAGVSNKNIAADLNLSQRTVENHRASVMKKTGSTSLPALARLALAAEWIGADEAPT